MQDPQTHEWHVTILRRRSLPAGQISEHERKFVVKHVIFCTGLGSPNPRIPAYPGLDTFKGDVMHSIRYKRASDYRGKRVTIIGACTSGLCSVFSSVNVRLCIHFQHTTSPWIAMGLESVSFVTAKHRLCW